MPGLPAEPESDVAPEQLASPATATQLADPVFASCAVPTLSWLTFDELVRWLPLQLAVPSAPTQFDEAVLPV